MVFGPQSLNIRVLRALGFVTAARNQRKDQEPSTGAIGAAERLLTVGAFFFRIGFPLKGSFKRATIRDLEGYYSIGALIIRIGFWGPLYCKYNKEPPRK